MNTIAYCRAYLKAISEPVYGLVDKHDNNGHHHNAVLSFSRTLGIHFRNNILNLYCVILKF